jgi:hypothetical protein
MITICAWCEKEIQKTNDKPIDLISHGICPDCIGKAKEEANRIKKLPWGMTASVGKEIKEIKCED